MNTTVISPQVGTGDLAVTSRLHVVMLCEDADAAQCGEGVYQTLVGQLGEGFDLDLRAWRFSELAPLNLRLAAAWQAAKANLILIACQGIRALPRAVQGWLDLWVGRQSNPCALILVLAGQQGPAPMRREIQECLQAAAARGQMDFFTNAGGATGADSNWQDQETRDMEDSAVLSVARAS